MEQPQQMDQQMLAWDVAQQFNEQWSHYKNATDRFTAQVQMMGRAAENTRQQYNAVVQERDMLRTQLLSAEARLTEVQRIVQRYTVVQDPVVASDGYTYERGVISKYLDDCHSAAPPMPAVSQQTSETLTEVLVPNQSLKKLVELLKVIKPQEVPPVSDATTFKAPEEVFDGEAQGGSDGRLHPCVRVYGFCNYKESCAYAKYPYESCLSHLKGKCRFGGSCHELHVEFKAPQNATHSRPPRGARTQGHQQAPPAHQ
jgi:hypothetical protein